MEVQYLSVSELDRRIFSFSFLLNVIFSHAFLSVRYFVAQQNILYVVYPKTPQLYSPVI